MAIKHAKLQSLQDAYNSKAAAFNINVLKGKTKKRCAECHLRVNHTQRNGGGPRGRAVKSAVS